ncbi:hypothetical protein A9Q76_02625 [Arcobacter sp. 31_11_sub10_T18]|nr:hypothetical protein A9Q76_02625 [Arcobacter sp. 31_11_sub10_T18]
MHKLNIYTKSKTLIINELNKHADLNFLDDKSVSTIIPDIYFHSGKIDKSLIPTITKSKKVIVNSKSAKDEIVKKIEVDENKVHVIYPAIKKLDINIKEARKEFCEELEISKKTRIIFFTARTLKTNGVKELFDILLSLSNDNYKLIIASDKEQITTLKFQIAKYNLDDKIIFYEDFKNMDLLYAVSDIFVLPTYVKNFSLSILKAMSLKTAVFVSSTNSARELVDIFATMESPSDPNTSFKIDALLSEKDDLKLIKKSNQKIAKDFYIEKQIQRLLSILNIT